MKSFRQEMFVTKNQLRAKEAEFAKLLSRQNKFAETIASFVNACLTDEVPADGVRVSLIHSQNKISVIKGIREITGWGLVEAKNFVDEVVSCGGPVLLKVPAGYEAASWVARARTILTAAGATVT